MKQKSSIFAILVAFAAGEPALAGERVCELITQSEASGAVGGNVRPGMPSAGESGDHLCRYVAGTQGMVAIALAEQHGREKYDQAKAKIQSDPALKSESVPGLGDQAVFASISKGISQLLIVKGDKSIEIALSGRGVNSSKETLIELARKALSRL